MAGGDKTNSDFTVFKSSDEIQSLANKVADWQIANLRADYQRQWPEDNRLTSWVYGAMYVGFLRWAETIDNKSYMRFLISLGVEFDWQLAGRKFNADDHVVGQTWLRLYETYGDPSMLEPTLANMRQILASPSAQPMAYDDHAHTERWTWCDALFMAPPVWAKLANITGESQFRDFMFREYLATKKHLFDENEALFYRDNSFIKQRENGEKVFWSRGNGWVFAGLALLIPELPDGPQKRELLNLYKKMADRLLSLQRSDGFWPMSLLNSENYPTSETSGTGFFSFGLAWGVNAGVLDGEKYIPAAYKAWSAVASKVDEQGFLGYVQPIGAAPGEAWPDRTEVYGVGAFLLASSELIKFVQQNKSK